MTEHTSTESARSRWTTRISIALAVIAALVVLVFIKFGSLHRSHFVGHGPVGGSTWIQDVTWLLWDGKEMNKRALNGVQLSRSRNMFVNYRFIGFVEFIVFLELVSEYVN